MNVIETEFIKNVNSTTFHDMVERVKLKSVTFPCNEHKDYAIIYSIKYYISKWLRQFTRQ